MNYYPERPLVVQSDFSILLETAHLQFEEVRSGLAQFSDLVKSPEHVHTYKISPLTLWNAAATGMKSGDVILFLNQHSKMDIPIAILNEVQQAFQRYGAVRMEASDDDDSVLHLVVRDSELLKDIMDESSLAIFEIKQLDPNVLTFSREHRGTLKQELTRLGYPVEDAAGYHQGEFLQIPNSTVNPLQLRDYQEDAVNSFYRPGSRGGGSGVLVLPCGAGKTVIGIAAMSRLNCATLILTTNVTSVRQWKREILDKTGLGSNEVGEYSGTVKEVRPVTIATYQILTYRKSKSDSFAHMSLFNERDWGLIIYDEVHLLPAPVFRATADIQATRRLGLTATLVREDGCEEDVFSLIGPKRYEMPWKQLQKQGWIADVECTEIRVPFSHANRIAYMETEPKSQARIAGENEMKLPVVKKVLERHSGEPTLIIGQYLDQLESIAQMSGAPFISGSMAHDEREKLYAEFKSGKLRLLVVSKVANFAVDLPDAKVAIQVSGSFGSRQEEAQRLGRILRPKKGDNRGSFYSIVTTDSKEQDYAMNRQLFLIEQGYRYRIEEEATLE